MNANSSIAERNLSHAVDRFAVRYVNDVAVPVSVFDQDLVKFFFVSHTGVPREHHDVME